MVKWVYRTRTGQAQIIPTAKGFALMFDGAALGNYVSPAAVAEDLANGTSFWPSAGDPSEMGIPKDITEWQRIP
jgi:hypothetical protein